MDIKINNLGKTYGNKRVLQGINLHIGRGMFGLLGPNGAGKTTLMRIIAALIPATEGGITADGEGVSNNAAFRSKLGYLPQQFSFYPGMTVRETMDYLAILSGMKDRTGREARISELLAAVNLEEQCNLKTKYLSGGMKQRLGIAQALLNDPQLLIVDEPTAGLDPEERIRFRNLLSDFSLERTVILSTHIVGDIEFACERLAVLNRGEVLYQGGVAELVERARGIVREAVVAKGEQQAIRSNYPIVSYVTAGDKIKFRYISAAGQGEKSRGVEPTIEDAYLALMEGVI